VDWKHGVRQLRLPATTTTAAPTATPNPERERRCIIFRATKVFSDTQLALQRDQV
jgi:hypothetical protein